MAINTTWTATPRDSFIFDENGDCYIYTPADLVGAIELYNISVLTSSQVFHLMNDVDFSSDPSIPSFMNFYGTFKGHGFTISGISIGSSSTDGNALFKNNEGTIQDLTVSGTVVATKNAGGIVAVNKGLITRCVNKCNVSANSISSSSDFTPVGGIAGSTQSVSSTGIIGKIEKCANYGTITGSCRVGGIVGHFISGNVLNCFNVGNVIGTSYGTEYSSQVGGIVGAMDSSCTLATSYNRGLVNSDEGHGGVVGYYIPDDESYNVEGTYYLSTTAFKGFGNLTLADKVNHVESKTESEMKDKNTYASYDFKNVWCITKDYKLISDYTSEYPLLINNVSWDNVMDIEWFNPNKVINMIRTADQLASLNYVIDLLSLDTTNKKYNFILANDIDFKNRMMNYKIGNSSRKPFIHFFDGDGFKIKNLSVRGIIDSSGNIIDDKDRMISLFGYNSGVIKNVKLYQCSFYTEKIGATSLVEYNDGSVLNCRVEECECQSLKSYMGGIVGANTKTGMIYNCLFVNNRLDNKYNKAKTITQVTSDIVNHCVGGLCCFNYGNIFNCVVKNNMDLVNNNVGGVVGINYGNVFECNIRDYNAELYQSIPTSYSESYKNITGNDNVGGVVGTNYNKVSLCGCSDNVDGANVIGGIIGQNRVMFNDEDSKVKMTGTVTFCTNEGKLTADSKCGGIVGSNLLGVISDCCNYLGTIDCPNISGGIVGNFNGFISRCSEASTLPDTTTRANYVGGIIGYIDNAQIETKQAYVVIKNNYHKDDDDHRKAIGGAWSVTTPYDIVGGAETITEASMKVKSSFVNFDFSNVWFIKNIDNTEKSYPHIQKELVHNTKNFIPQDNRIQSLGLKHKNFKQVHTERLMLADLGEINAYISEMDGYINLPSIRYVNYQWQVSHDGTNYSHIGNAIIKVGLLDTPPANTDFYLKFEE